MYKVIFTTNDKIIINDKIFNRIQTIKITVTFKIRKSLHSKMDKRFRLKFETIVTSIKQIVLKTKN